MSFLLFKNYHIFTYIYIYMYEHQTSIDQPIKALQNKSNHISK